MFQQLTQKFSDVIDRLKGRATLNEANIDETLRQIRVNLLEADVNFKVVKEFCERVKQKALGEAVHKSLTPDRQFVKIFHSELVGLMGEAGEPALTFKPPVVLMLVGLQGSGKTTTAAKLARYYKEEKKRFPYLVPADVYRPAAIEQLKTLAQKIDVPCYDSHPKDDPVKLCRKAVELAAERGADTVILDTAGRMQIDQALMKELEKIKSKVDVQHSLLVVDSMVGQEAVNVAKSFHELLQISGVILTKMDGDARGGAALSVKYVTGVPIYFAGVGEKIEDLEPFYPDRVASRILGMGDLLGLIEKAQKDFDAEEAKAMAQKVMRSEFNLEDFRKQLGQMKKLGPVEKVLGMIPGMGRLSDQVDPKDMERELKRKEAILNSMTLQERRNAKILNGSRRLRIAKGSGTQVSEVNRLLKEFEQMQKMMKRFGKFGLKGLRGLMPGL
ncbi:MAG TPA: signal recognition particle protein [Deltaproteobacteria bacterium]|nr:signal recognition particle protein [Deltaproteobacteria bacterium]